MALPNGIIESTSMGGSSPVHDKFPVDMNMAQVDLNIEEAQVKPL